MSRPSFSPLRLAGFVILLALVESGALAQEHIGISSAVNPEVTGAPPGAVARQVVIGQDVVFNERFTTGPLGQTQLLFLDESAMTIGPNSDLTIDQFVYDPKSGTGHLAMSTSRGLLRFVGGKLSKQEEGVSLRTSTATLAVRGGAFLLDLTTEGRMGAIFIYGRTLTVTGADGVTQTLHRPGFAISIGGPGGAPSAPFPVPPGRIAQLVSHLDGRVGATGGARTVPSDATVARSGVAATISGDVAGSVQQATQSQPTPQVQTVSVSSLQSSADIGTVQSQGSSVIQRADTMRTPPGTVLGSSSKVTTTTAMVTTTNMTPNAQLVSPLPNAQLISPPPVGRLVGPILGHPPVNQNFVSGLVTVPR
jgi:hypothetical protein